MNNLNKNLDDEPKQLAINNKIVESVIANEEFNVFAGIFTICTLTLKNGHEVLGQHNCPDHSEYIEEVSRRLARENACEKIWSLEAYLMKERQSQKGSLESIVTKDPCWKDMDLFVWRENKEFVIKGKFNEKHIGRCFLKYKNARADEKYLDLIGYGAIILHDPIIAKMKYFELPED